MARETVDVDSLVADLRREAAELREQAGPSAVEAEDSSPLESGERPSPSALLLRDLSRRLARLRELADPRGGPLESHRGAFGAPILAVKRVLIRLLTPIWDQQTLSAEAVVEQLEQIAGAVQQVASRLDGQIAQIDRRLAAVEDSHLAAGGPAQDLDPGFDYEAFEAAFRGAPETVREAQRAYLRFFAGPDAGPVLDLGCGEGVFLGLLRENGIEARGVDRSAGAVARAREAGLDVRQGDLLKALHECPDHSLGGVVSMQVVEHLTLPTTLHLLRTAKRKLRPGGVFLAETVNLASLIVFARGWSIDPTHRQALHPLTLKFLVEQAGFSQTELLYSSEAETRLEIPEDDDLAARNAARLNDVVFASQDFAVVGRA